MMFYDYSLYICPSLGLPSHIAETIVHDFGRATVVPNIGRGCIVMERNGGAKWRMEIGVGRRSEGAGEAREATVGDGNRVGERSEETRRVLGERKEN